MSTDARIAANIDQGFRPKNRSAAVVPVRTREEKVVHRPQALALARVVKPSQLVMAQRRVAYLQL
jgi:hypothetical protein